MRGKHATVIDEDDALRSFKRSQLLHAKLDKFLLANFRALHYAIAPERNIEFAVVREVSDRQLHRDVGSGEWQQGKIEGNLAIKGITKPITLNAEFFGAGTNPMSKKLQVGFSATTQLKRSEFGLGYGVPAVTPDEVDLRILLHSRTLNDRRAAKPLELHSSFGFHARGLPRTPRTIQSDAVRP